MRDFTNQAQLSYSGLTTKSNIATGQIVDVLSVTKSVLTNNYYLDKEKTILVKITNSGDADYTGLTVIDDLGAYSFTPAGGTVTRVYPLSYINDTAKSYVNGVPKDLANVTYGNVLTISGVDVPANSTVSIVYNVVPNKFAPLAENSTITANTAVSGGGLSQELTASVTLNVEEKAILDISKVITPKEIVENGKATYTFIISNKGNIATEETDNVAITDTFIPKISALQVYLNDATMPSTDYTYTESEGSGLFSTVAGKINVAAATFEQNTTTGEWYTVPSTTVLEVNGTI